MINYTYCGVCEEACSYEEAVREIDGCYRHICYDCCQLPDCQECDGSGEHSKNQTTCDVCCGIGKETR